MWNLKNENNNNKRALASHMSSQYHHQHLAHICVSWHGILEVYKQRPDIQFTNNTIVQSSVHLTETEETLKQPIVMRSQKFYKR